jgi:hypothetical protein
MNNVEVVIKNGHMIHKFFKGRLIGLMTNDDAQAVRNTPGIGRKIYTEATMPFEDLRALRCGMSRIIIANPTNKTVLVTPVVRWYSARGSDIGEFGCRGKNFEQIVYALRKLTKEEAKE